MGNKEKGNNLHLPLLLLEEEEEGKKGVLGGGGRRLFRFGDQILESLGGGLCVRESGLQTANARSPG